MSRTVKQILYGTLYLAILSVIGWWVYSVTLAPAPSCFDNTQNGGETGVDCGGPCISCEIKHLQPLSIGPGLLLGSDRVFSATAEVTDPNDAYSARSFAYSVTFSDANGTVLQTVDQIGFLYAGQTKDLIVAGVGIANGIPVKATFGMDPASAVWAKSADFSEPIYELTNPTATISGTQMLITGTIINPNNIPISTIRLGAFAVDNLGMKIGASTTILQNLGQFRQQTFQITVPLQKNILGSVDLQASATSIEVQALQ